MYILAGVDSFETRRLRWSALFSRNTGLAPWRTGMYGSTDFHYRRLLCCDDQVKAEGGQSAEGETGGNKIKGRQSLRRDDIYVLTYCDEVYLYDS